MATWPAVLPIGVAFGGVCVAFVAFALPKRHTPKALSCKALRRVWRLWRLFSLFWISKKKQKLIVRIYQPHPATGSGIPTNGDAEERTIILSEKRRG